MRKRDFDRLVQKLGGECTVNKYSGYMSMDIWAPANHYWHGSDCPVITMAGLNYKGAMDEYREDAAELLREGVYYVEPKTGPLKLCGAAL